MREVTMNIKEIQRIIPGYYKELYNTKFNNLREMDKFFPRLNHEELENLHRLNENKKIETVIKNLSENKSRTR